jgi:hypothetical protein
LRGQRREGRFAVERADVFVGNHDSVSELTALADERGKTL